MTQNNARFSALVVASPHIERILSGEKTWEMRSKSCKKRGRIGLIRKGSGHVVGVVDIVGVQGPLTPEEMLIHQNRHRIPVDQLRDPGITKWNRAWVLDNVRVLRRPVPYRHVKGSQSWVSLDAETQARIAEQL